MAILQLDVNQASTVFGAIASQATGKAQIAPVDASSFVSLAQTTLLTGYDKVMQSISQVLSKTIFSVRAYDGRFKGLMVDNEKFGNHVRKLTPYGGSIADDESWNLVDGQSIDMYEVNKPKVLQTNFYGENVWSKTLTRFKDQLDVALTGPAEFTAFLNMVITHVNNEISTVKESVARNLVCNYMAAKKQADSTNVIYLLDQYQAETGVSLTKTTVKAPANWPAFAKWLIGYIGDIANKLTDRTIKYHMNFTINGNAVDIERHTPYAAQKAYFNAKILKSIETEVKSDSFHDEYLKMVDHEAVNYWQSPDSPLEINVTPAYNNADGTQQSSPTAVNLTDVFGVIFDEEAMGITTVNEWTATTPLNTKGGYTNTDWHFTTKYWTDLTENGVVFILDKATP